MEESIVVREQNEKKRRKLKSDVWNHFTKPEPGEDGKQLAICKHCEAKFDGSSKKGTTHLKNHLESKICQDKRKGVDDDGNGDKSTKTRDLATPVVMKKTSSVIDLIKGIFDEDFDPSVVNSRKVEILQLYKEEKEKLGVFLNKLSCRFSLHIVDLCGEELHLIVHYIDDSWERQIKFIDTRLSRKNYIEEMKAWCLALKIDRKICSIQPEIFREDKEVIEIESWFSQRGSLSFAGIVRDFEGFICNIRYLTYFSEMIEMDGLRKCVDYGYNKTSSMKRAVNEAVIKGKKVIFNDHPMFYWPFDYLKVAVGLKEAFSELEKIDPDFNSIKLTNQKWDEATTTFEHLKAWKEFLKIDLDNCSITTTTVVYILKLFGCHRSEDCHVCKNASYKKLFDEIKIYWIVVILDPRFKMDTLHCWYEEFYGSDDVFGYFEKINKYFRDVYNEYAKDSGNNYKMMEVMGKPTTSSTKSELDLYLYDLKVPVVEEFDILAWWRGNAPFYPTLARMARDYLTLPIQRLDMDSDLIDEINFIDKCSKIDEDMKSALTYLRGWLCYEVSPRKNK